MSRPIPQIAFDENSGTSVLYTDKGPIYMDRIESIVMEDKLPYFHSGEKIRLRFVDDTDMHRIVDQGLAPRGGFINKCFTCGGSRAENMVVFENQSKGRYSSEWPLDDGYCDCQFQYNLRLDYHNAGISSEFFSSRFEDDDPECSFHGDDVLKEACGTYLANHEDNVSKGIGLCFEGASNSGKSMALYLTVKELVKLGYSCTCISMSELVKMATSGWRDYTIQEDYDRRVMNRKVLFIDNVGQELNHYANGGQNIPKRELADVLAYRNTKKLVTFLCCYGEENLLTGGHVYSAATPFIDSSLFCVRAKDHIVTKGPGRKQDKPVVRKTQIRMNNSVGGYSPSVSRQPSSHDNHDGQGTRYVKPSVSIDGSSPRRKII